MDAVVITSNEVTEVPVYVGYTSCYVSLTHICERHVYVCVCVCFVAVATCFECNCYNLRVCAHTLAVMEAQTDGANVSRFVCFA